MSPVTKAPANISQTNTLAVGPGTVRPPHPNPRAGGVSRRAPAALPRLAGEGWGDRNGSGAVLRRPVNAVSVRRWWPACGRPRHPATIHEQKRGSGHQHLQSNA
ncbi:hypothetical protein GCM10009578_065370 [Streptomyces rhizosphaericus]